MIVALFNQKDGVRLARDTLHREAPELARDADHIVIDGLPHVTARLTLDVTPDLRGRIKIAAFRRRITVADMLRDLLTREFPEDPGDAS